MNGSACRNVTPDDRFVLHLTVDPVWKPLTELKEQPEILERLTAIRRDPTH